MKINKIGLWVFLCFPNFLAWGRFYGKDSWSFFLASLVALAIARIAILQKASLFSIALNIMLPLYLLHMVRPHIALAIGAGVGFSLLKLMTSFPSKGTVGYQGFVRFILPISALILVSILGYYEVKKLVGTKTVVRQENISDALIKSTIQGTGGRSTTAIAEEMKADQRAVLRPSQIFKNIFMLFFAPMPWKIRNLVDIIALFSNGLLLLLLIRFYKQIWSKDFFQLFLMAIAGLLIFLLSFMTANVGLILRQKTIVLPFLFLILLYPARNRELYANT